MRKVAWWKTRSESSNELRRAGGGEDNCSSISLRSFSRVIAPDRINFPCRLPFSFATPLPRPRDLPRKIRDTSAFTTFYSGYSPFFSPPRRNVTLYGFTPRVKAIVPSEGVSPGKGGGNHQIWTVTIRANGDRKGGGGRGARVSLWRICCEMVSSDLTRFCTFVN